jgi:glycosyltransferase involved in cell wall biosynthesis
MKHSIFALYAAGDYFSGQRFAVEIVIKGLGERGWKVVALKFPALNRMKKLNFLSSLLNVISNVPVLLYSYFRACTLDRRAIVYVGLGQTRFSLLREGFPLILRGYLFRNNRAVVSLNGSNFMQWPKFSIESRLLRRVLRSVKFVSVVGPSQATKLIELGIPQDKVVIVDNTCLLSSMPEEDLLVKHFATLNTNKVNVLFLSSLIESKGYIRFLEAICLLAQNSDYSLNVVICGTVTLERTCDKKFATVEGAQEWIESKINEINHSKNVTIQWIHGAIGVEKKLLFREAHIFVLPTQYKTEAQPIVVLEALASGCAVITTRVGEMPTTVNSETAILLGNNSSYEIAAAISELHKDVESRTSFALNGLRLFNNRFTYNSHIDVWEKVFSEVNSSIPLPALYSGKELQDGWRRLFSIYSRNGQQSRIRKSPS